MHGEMKFFYKLLVVIAEVKNMQRKTWCGMKIMSWKFSSYLHYTIWPGKYRSVDSCECGNKLHNFSSSSQRQREPREELSNMAYIKVLCLLFGDIEASPSKRKENKSCDRENTVKRRNIYNCVIFSPNKSIIARQVTVFSA